MKDLFSLEIDSHSLLRFKADLAEYYAFTYKKLIKHIINGKVIHADETSVKLREEIGYAWVFTNMEEVVFLFKLSREGGFLKNFLKGFNGVLISDFYTAYDSVSCSQ